MTELRQHPNSITRNTGSARRIARGTGIFLATLIAFGASSAVMAAEPTSAPTSETAQTAPSEHRDGSDKANATADGKTATTQTQQQAFTDYVKTSRGWVIGDVQLVRV